MWWIDCCNKHFKFRWLNIYKFYSIAVSAKEKDGSVDVAMQALLRCLVAKLETSHLAAQSIAMVENPVAKRKERHKDTEKLKENPEENETFKSLTDTGINEVQIHY